MTEERRRYRRVQAPVYCRPLGFRIFDAPQRAQDIGEGGLRIYSDDEVKKGTRLELELFLPDATSVSCKVEVAWIERLSRDAPARFDVGLKLTSIEEADLRRLAVVLDDADPA